MAVTELDLARAMRAQLATEQIPTVVIPNAFDRDEFRVFSPDLAIEIAGQQTYVELRLHRRKSSSLRQMVFESYVDRFDANALIIEADDQAASFVLCPAGSKEWREMERVELPSGLDAERLVDALVRVLSRSTPEREHDGVSAR